VAAFAAAAAAVLANTAVASADDGADWLPLRSTDKRAGIKVGCTWSKPSSSCPGGYHYTTGKAIDFLVPAGTPVFASGAGSIYQAQGGCGVRTVCNGGRGNYITIKHKSRYSRYLHLSKIVVSSGSVAAGQLIGYSGNSGQKSVDHLHYDEITDPVNGRGKLDPGTLYACHGTTKKAYASWPTFTYGTAIRNDGYEFGCSTGAISIYALANGRYVSAEAAYSGSRNGMLRARATAVQGWERFQIVGNCRASSGCAIRALANGRYVSAERAYTGIDNGMLRARATTVGTWERFKLSGDCMTGCALLALANNRYVSAERSYTGSRNGMLRARATAIGTWEKFRFRSG
jgi:hypothetical protein